MSKIVVFDPSGRLVDGTIIDGPKAENLAQHGDLLCLPYQTGREAEQLGGYARRGWGVPGWCLERNVGERVCPLLVRVDVDAPWIHWAVRLVPIGPNPTGQIRLVSDSSFGGPQCGALTATGGDVIQVERLARLDGPGAWQLTGRRRISVHTKGLMALSLYATARDVAVQVTAVSQTKIE